MDLQPETAPVSPQKSPRYQAPRHTFDRRTKAARRFALLVSEFTDQLGGKTLVSEARLATVRQLAGVIIAAEEYQAAIIRGEEVDAEQLVRISNLQARLTRQLGLDDADAKPKPRTLADKLAEHGKAA
jgi:hypothetical protein